MEQTQLKDNELPESERYSHTEIVKFTGWDSIEQLEGVIGEEKTYRLYFGEVDGETIEYDIEITIRRIARSEKPNP